MIYDICLLKSNNRKYWMQNIYILENKLNMGLMEELNTRSRNVFLEDKI